MLGRIYFETSAWNSLDRHPKKDWLIAALRTSGAEVLASPPQKYS